MVTCLCVITQISPMRQICTAAEAWRSTLSFDCWFWMSSRLSKSLLGSSAVQPYPDPLHHGLVDERQALFDDGEGLRVEEAPTLLEHGLQAGDGLLVLGRGGLHGRDDVRR